MNGHSRPGWRSMMGIPLVAMLALSIPPSVAASGGTVRHERTIVHHEINTEYFPDDICGPRAGWTTFDVTWHFMVTDLGDSFHVQYMETGTYTTDLDDPAFADYSGQFTDAVHVNLTRGGTSVTTDAFHDFPGSITIKVRTVLVDVRGQVQVDRSVFEVTGCP